jgi:virginiamycin B lyase
MESAVAPSDTTSAGDLPTGAKIADEIEIALRDVRWLAVDSTAVWVNADREIVRVDPASGDIVGRVETPPIKYGSLASGENGLWQASFDQDVVLRVDPETNSVVETIAVGDAPEGVGTTPGAIWVANHHAGTVSRIDPLTNTVVATIDIGPRGNDGPLELAAGSTGIWVHVPNLGRVVRLDAQTGCVSGAVQVDGAPTVDGGSVWIVDPSLRAVVHVDGATSHIVAAVGLGLSEGALIGGLAAGLGSVWVSTDKGLFRIDESKGRAVGLLPVPLGDVAVGASAVWLVPYKDASLIKIAPE